ncbi:HD domain-containing protein [Streptomyces netropsis]
MGVVEDGRFGGIDVCPWGEFDAATLTAYPLLFRMIDSAAVVSELWDRFLAGSQRALVAGALRTSLEDAQSISAFVVGLQDIGMLVPYLQRSVPSAWARLTDELVAQAGSTVGIPRERASAHTGVGLFAQAGFVVAGNDSPGVRAAQVLGGCSGRFLQVDVDQGASSARVGAMLGGSAWRSLRERYARLLGHLCGVQEAPARISVEAAVLIAGLGMVADRIASRRRFWVANAHMPSFGAYEHSGRARAQAREAVGVTGLARFDLEKVPFTQAHPRCARPNALQASVMEDLPRLVAGQGAGIMVVTDATGSGKSVAALEAARIFNAYCGTQGLLWLLPTTATADAAYDILNGYVRAHRPERAPVTLVHSHSWLNAAYGDQFLAPPGDVHAAGDRQSTDGPAGGDHDAGADGEEAPGPGEWLRGWDAALLAQFAVATVDQALMAVLPVRFNALRLLALSGRTVVIDEAHALAPFSHLQLRRLLNWLGVLGSPVVLLSATMPASTCQELVRAYLSGAGHPASALDGRCFAPAYPGWLFAAAATGTCHRMDADARRSHIVAQRRRVRVQSRPVCHRRLGEASRMVEEDERLAVIGELIGPVAREGGCASVGCATVGDAQDVYQYLKRTWPGAADDLVLLHARFPGHVREATMGRVRRLLGPDGPRPDRLVVVTTSLLDMSMDIDVDVMISDLASIARLLQRAGRLGRFAHQRADEEMRRPSWWSDKDPCLTVLHPVGAQGKTAIPPGWRTVEPAYLLHATAGLLPALEAAPLTIPDQVQELVEHVHGSSSVFAAATTELRRMLEGHQSRVDQEEHLGAVHLIPAPGRVSSLADLHRQYLTTAQAATRLGTMPRRLLPCYRTPDGTLTLDREGLHPLPERPSMTAAGVRRILQHTLPVPAAWVARRNLAHHPPVAWREHPLLADLVLLPSDGARPERLEHFGRHQLRMDNELGLVHRQLP